MVKGMMKNKNSIRIIAVSAAVVSALVVTVFAAGYDSAKDPLVSLSYIEGVVLPQINGKFSNVDSRISGISGEIDSLKNRISALEKGSGTGSSELPADAKNRLEALESGNAAQDKRLDSIEKEIDSIKDSAGGVYEDYSYNTVHVTGVGSVLKTAGSTDIILKSGSAVSCGGDLYDLTADAALVNGADIKADHAVTVTSSSVKLTSEEAYFLVRGDYQIVQQ